MTPVEFRGDLWHQKTRVPAVSCGVICVMLRFAVVVEHRLVTDRHRHRHRPMASTADAWHRAVKTWGLTARIGYLTALPFSENVNVRFLVCLFSYAAVISVFVRWLKLASGGRSNKKLSYRRGTARCVMSIEILPIATQQCRNYTTSPDQIDGMKLEI